MDPLFDANGPLSSYEQACIDTARASNEIALWVGIAQAVAVLVVGLIQAGVIGWGVRYVVWLGVLYKQRLALCYATHRATVMRQRAIAARQQAIAARTLIERRALLTPPWSSATI